MKFISFWLVLTIAFAPLAQADDFVPEGEDDVTVSANVFTLDGDDTGGNISLQFGAALAEALEWDNTNSRFYLSTSLELNGEVLQNGNTLTLDADNTAAGANVSIIAEQGTDNNGILRYNTSNNEWELSNDGGVFEKISTSVYGTEFNLLESVSVSTSTVTAFTEKINGNTSALPVGTYKIMASYGWNVDSVGSDFVSRLFFDGVNLDAANNNEMHRQEAKEAAGTFSTTGTSQKHGFTKNYYVNVTTPGAKNVVLEWASEAGGIEASLWDTRIEIVRVQ